MASGTLVKRVLLQISADDGDTEEKLDRITLKADELAEKHPELKVRIDTAAASAKVAVLREELRGLSRQADEEAVKGGLLSRMLGGYGNAGNGIPDTLGPVPLPALIAIIPALEAALVEVDGLASGFAAAGAGAGAFALLAMPAFKAVSGAWTQINADQLAYNRALTAAQRSTALAHLKQDYANLDPSQRAAVEGIRALVGEYHKLSKAFEPQAFKVFSDVLHIANEVLPDVTPFASTFATAIGGLLQQAGRFAGSQGFKDWLSQFHSLEGPSITAIGTGIGHVVTSIGKLFTIMSAKDVVNSINIAFSVIDGAIASVGWTISHIMHSWDQLTSGVDHARAVIEDDAHNIAHWWDSLRHSAATLAHDTAAHFGEIRHDLAQWAGDVHHDADMVAGWFRELPGRIMSALAALPGMLFRAGQGAIQGLLRGAESMIGSVLSTVGNWGHDIANAIGGAFGIHFSEPSEATLMIKAGRNVALGLGLGIEQGTAAAHASALRLSRAAGLTGAAGAVGAGGYGGGTLRLEWVGGNADAALITLLKKHIRLRGGDPAVLGA